MKVPFSGLLGFGTAVRPSPTIRHESARQPSAQPRFGFSDGGDLFVARRPAAKEETRLQYREATPDVMDYQGHFNVETGQQFAEERFKTHQSPVITGKELLDFLVTPGAIDPQRPPVSDDAWRALDFSRLGKTESEINGLFRQKEQQAERAESQQGIASRPIFPLDFPAELLRSAHNKGLVYQLRNPSESGKIYYGVPAKVREKLGLEIPVAEAARPAFEALSVRTQLGAGLKSFLNNPAVQPGSADEELSEYAAQLALSAILQGHVKAHEVPAKLLQHADDLGLIGARNYSVLEDLAEVVTPVLSAQVRNLQDMAEEMKQKPFSVLA